jgi:DNA-directed RNA polymerase specialized sigma24 family protein
VRNEQVLAALGELTPLMRAVVVLRFYEDLPDAQTAELLSCPVGTVETEGSVAVARLRELLADLASDEEAGRR